MLSVHGFILVIILLRVSNWSAPQQESANILQVTEIQSCLNISKQSSINSPAPDASCSYHQVMTHQHPSRPSASEQIAAGSNRDTKMVRNHWMTLLWRVDRRKRSKPPGLDCCVQVYSRDSR